MRYARGSVSSDALHVAFLTTNASSPARVRMAVRDILNHTDANVDVVVHLISDKMDETYPSALPLCAGLSVNLLDATIMKDASVRRLCNIFRLGPQEHQCYYLLKPLLYKWMPPEVDAVLILDTDTRILGDVRELLVTELAAQRAAGAFLGLAPEMQAIYAHFIGLEGFNGGVQLQDLRAMRVFGPAAFEAFLNGLALDAATKLFGDVARQGDQSLLTLLNTTALGRTGGVGGAPVLRPLPCTWNLQLCLYHWNMVQENRANYPWLNIASCKGAPRLIHGSSMYGEYHLDAWDDAKLVRIVNRVKAVGHAAPLGSWCDGGPVLETLGQYGSDADS